MAGDRAPDGAGVRARFVLHEHRRPRHHFDLRLEENGVLRSWALPRGLPPDPAEDRLAIEVADHDLDHLLYQDAARRGRPARPGAGDRPGHGRSTRMTVTGVGLAGATGGNYATCPVAR